MLTDDLSDTLRRHAEQLPAPSRTLLPAVEHRAQVLRRRRLAGLTGVLVLALAASGISAGALRGRPAGHPGTLGVAGQSDTDLIARTGLTGSMCDPVGATAPLNFLDWPCVAATTGVAATIERRLANQLNTSYGSITHPLVRLIASDGQPGGNSLAEWWDASNPETPTQLLETQNNGGSGFPATPAHDPAILTDQVAVFARPPIASVELAGRAAPLELHGGVAALPAIDATGYAGTGLQGRTATGATRAGWSIPVGPPIADTSVADCTGKAGVGTCSPIPTYLLDKVAESPTGDCSSAAQPLPAYLDWPCPAAADASTTQRVAAAVTAVVATHGHISAPRARLLADTRDSGPAGAHDAATLVEVWDAASPGPAVLVTIVGRPGGPNVYVSQDDQTPTGDPTVVAEGDSDPAIPPGADGRGPNILLLFSRASVAYDVYTAATPRARALTVNPRGGVASVVIPDATDAAGVSATGTLVAHTADGATVYTTDYVGVGSSNPCTDGVTGTTCPTGLLDDGPGTPVPPSASPA